MSDRFPSWSDYATHEQSAYPELWEGCVGAWCPSLGPTGLRLYDLSGRNNRGTLTNMNVASNWVIGGSTYTLDFNGENNHVNLGSHNSLALSGRSAGTISGWFKNLSIAPVWKRILARKHVPAADNTGWQLSVHHETGTGYYFLRGNTQDRTALYSGVFGAWVWHHVAATYDGTTMAIYVNGILCNTKESTISLETENTETYLARKEYYDSYWQGQLDDIRIYNRALSPSEIRLLATQRGIAYTPRRRRSIRVQDTGGGGGASGSVSATLDGISAAATGAVLVQGAATATLTDISPVAAGAALVQGAAPAVLDHLVATTTATVLVQGTAAAVPDDLVAATTATVLVVGAVPGTLDDLATTAAAVVLVGGSVTATTADLDAVITGVLGAVTTGAVTATLSDLVVTAAGAVQVIGTATGTLDALAATASGAVRIVGVTTSSLDDLVMTATAVVSSGPTGSVAAAFAGLVALTGGTVLVRADVSAMWADLTVIATGGQPVVVSRLLRVLGRDDTGLLFRGRDDTYARISGSESMAIETTLAIVRGDDYRLEMTIAGSGSISGDTFSLFIAIDPSGVVVLNKTMTIADAIGRKITVDLSRAETAALSRQQRYRWAIVRTNPGRYATLGRGRLAILEEASPLV